MYKTARRLKRKKASRVVSQVHAAAGKQRADSLRQQNHRRLMARPSDTFIPIRWLANVQSDNDQKKNQQNNVGANDSVGPTNLPRSLVAPSFSRPLSLSLARTVF